MRLQERLQKKIEDHGEEFAINGSITARGFFQLLDTGKMRTFLDDTEVMTVPRPATFLYTLPDVALAEDDTIVRDGRTYTVRKVAIERFEGVPVVQLAVLG